MADATSIETTLKEKRRFKPDPAFAKRANVAGQAAYKKLVREGERNPEKFWARMAKQHVSWFSPWKKTLEWKPPFAKWFIGGKTNVSYNCLDRHLEGPNAWRRNKAAIIWEGEPGDSRTLTYGDLHREVCKFANVLLARGVEKGDRVVLYMPLVPELAIAMLACTRIGAIHSIIFGGFSAESVRDRINDAEAKLVVTADGGWRRGAIIPLKSLVDDALAGTKCVESVIVLRRTGHEILMKEGRDLWWHEQMAEAMADCKPAKMDAEAPLFILYTSGSTGKPKGVLHTTGGYLTHVTATAKYIFDLREDDTYWCTADIGWITGHSYVVYGLLANGATSVMYEGAPNWPDVERFWRIIDKYRVTILYTAPTAIRTFMRWGDEHVKKYSLASLRLLGSVGEPINPEAWMWYRRTIGRNRCPIVDTWWQTETGGILITPIPGAVTTMPGSATLPFPGVFPEIWDESGKPVATNSGGFLVLDQALAGHAARHLGRLGTLPRAVLLEVPEHVLHRRRRASRRERLLLDRGPRRRRDERRRSPAVHHGGRERAGVASVGRRGGGRGSPGRDQGHGGRVLRHTEKWHRARSEPRKRTQGLGGEGDRGDRAPRRRALRRRAAQDTLGEDHAPAPARRGRGARDGGRYDHARGPVGAREAARF